MKKSIGRYGWIMVLALIIIGVAIIWFWIEADKKKLRFVTVKVDRDTIISTVNTTGTLQSVIAVEIGSQVSGKIKKLYVDFNSHVKKGQVLAKIDPSLFQAQADEASANVASARATTANYQAQYENALSRVKASQAAVKSAEAQMEISRANLASAIISQKSAKAGLDKAIAQLENDRLEYNRAQELMKKDFISRTEMDAAHTKYKLSLAELDVARAALEQTSSSVRSAQMQLDSARYNLEAAKVEEKSQKALAKAVQAQVKQSMAQTLTATSKLKEALVNLGYTNIYSPIDGVVVSRTVDVGQTVAAAFQAPKLFLIAKDLRDMEVLANVDEADIGKVKEGLKASFTVDAFPDVEFAGIVKQVRSSSTLDQGVVKYQVIISAPNPHLMLKPGMTANIIITTEIREDCLRIANGAIRFRPDSVSNFPYPHASGNKNGPMGRKHQKHITCEEGRRFNVVWVYEGENKVRPEQVLLGITDGQYTEMKKGNLNVGDELIIGIKENKPKCKTTPRAGFGPGGMRLFH